MRIALWNAPLARELAAVLDAAHLGEPVHLEVGTPHECTAWLKAGTVDVALVPTLSVIQDPEAFSVIPGACLATGPTFGYAKLALYTGLDAVQTVRVDPRYAQEVVLTRILLAEHYNRSVEFVAQLNPADQPATHNGVLLVGEAAAGAPEEALNLSREWFELTTFPMVWGVFAGFLSAEQAQALRDALRDAPQHPDWPAADVQVHLDDAAEAGLDAWVHYLFMRGITEDMPQLPYIPLPATAPDPDADGPEYDAL